MAEIYTNQQEAGTADQDKLVDFQAYLDAHAHDALSSGLSTRMEETAGTVADVASVLAGDSLRRDGTGVNSLALRAAFYDMAQDVGKSFAPAFEAGGSRVSVRQAQYETALKVAQPISRLHLLAAFRAAGIEDLGDPQVFLSGLSFGDVINYASHQLGAGDTVQELHALLPTDDDAKRLLHAIIPGSERTSDIDGISLAEHELTNSARAGLDLTARMADAARLTSDVHRAGWEGSDAGADVTNSEFKPYDLSLRTSAADQYNSSLAAGRSMEEARVSALLKVAYDIYGYVKPAGAQSAAA